MNRKDGKLLEMLVQAIEQSLAPDAVVERNVKLPVLGSENKAFVQCDIVIRNGKPPRETITIIEVQDRESPVNINDFRGWQGKLSAVGAQHLYCVSRKTFSKSIKQLAALSGNTVKLITLKGIDIAQIPINLFTTNIIYHDVDILAIRKETTIFPSLAGEKLNALTDELATVKTNDLKFSFRPPIPIALSTICIEHVSGRRDVKSQTDTLSLGFDRPFFYYYATREFLPIELKIIFNWNSKRVEIPVTILSYEQNDHGALAWVLESFYESSRGPLWMKIPVIKTGVEYVIAGMLVTMPENMQVQLSLEKK